MTKIQLNRSGGFLGKRLQATSDVDLSQEEMLEALQKAAPEKNPLARDAFHYSVTINDNVTLPVDIELLEGNLREVVTSLQKNLKAPER